MSPAVRLLSDRSSHVLALVVTTHATRCAPSRVWWRRRRLVCAMGALGLLSYLALVLTTRHRRHSAHIVEPGSSIDLSTSTVHHCTPPLHSTTALHHWSTGPQVHCTPPLHSTTCLDTCRARPVDVASCSQSEEDWDGGQCD